MSRDFLKRFFLSLIFFFTSLLSPGFSSEMPEEPVPMKDVYRKLLGYEPSLEVPDPMKPVSGLFEKEGGILETRGLRMTIPHEAVLSPVSFSIHGAPPHIEKPLNMAALTPVYEMQPHDVRFTRPVTLTFDVPPSSKAPCLFIQKEAAQSRLLDEWILIPPKAMGEGRATFEVKSFSFGFVGTRDFEAPLDPGEISQLTPQDQKYNLVRPGLTYRAMCDDPTCESRQASPKGMMISQGFSQEKPFNPNEDLSEDKVRCVACQKPITETEAIDQVILFQAKGHLDYKERRRGATLQSKSFDTGPDKIILYSQNKGQAEDYNVFKMTVEKMLVNIPNQVATLTMDKDGNPLGSVFDLGADGAFGHIKLLIGDFISSKLIKNKKSFNEQTFQAGPGKALDEKGFDWTSTQDEEEFLKKLPEYKLAWIIGCHLTKPKNKDFVDKVVAFHQAGGSLMIWDDNDAKPGAYSTAVISRLFGIHLGGNDPGQKIMTSAAVAKDPLTFDGNHPMAVGLNSIHEGKTICFPDNVPDPVKVFAVSSAGKANIMYVEKGAMGGTSGPVVMDCGFTKLFAGCWDETAGTSRYVKNATCWLAGATTE